MKNKMPVLFVGHGSPMNIIDDNSFTRTLYELGKTLQPKSILVISAHWVIDKTKVVSVDHPNTIHDFYGFPEELYRIQYPAPGAPQLAQELAPVAESTEEWGLDHGSWAVLRLMFPEAKIPVTQLSLNRIRTLQQHFELGHELRRLREQGVLIIGSGNLVHNLREIVWRTEAPAFEWAVEFDAIVEKELSARSWDRLVDLTAFNERQFRRAHPSIEHYLPLLPVLGAADADESLAYPTAVIQNGSIAMRTVLIGA